MQTVVLEELQDLTSKQPLGLHTVHEPREKLEQRTELLQLVEHEHQSYCRLAQEFLLQVDDRCVVRFHRVLQSVGEGLQIKAWRERICFNFQRKFGVLIGARAVASNELSNLTVLRRDFVYVFERLHLCRM